MFLNALLSSNVGDAATSPQIGRLASIPTAGTEPVAKGFADAFLAESTGDQVFSETNLKTALDPSGVPEPNLEGVPTKLADTAPGLVGEQTEPASADLAPDLRNELGASKVASSTLSESAGKIADSAALIDQTRTPNAGAVSTDTSTLSRPEISIGEADQKQARQGIEATQSERRTPSPVQNDRPVSPQPSGETSDAKATPDPIVRATNPRSQAETPDLASESIVSPTRLADTKTSNAGTNGQLIEPNAEQTRGEAKDRTTQAPKPDVPLVDKTWTETTPTLSLKTSSPEPQTRGPEAATLRESINPQPERRGNSVEELPGLPTDNVRVVFAAKPATTEPGTGVANPTEISTAIPTDKKVPVNLPGLKNINVPELNTSSSQYERHKSGRHEDVSNYTRVREFSPYQNAAAALPGSPSGVAPTPAYLASAPLAASQGLALNSEATTALIPEEVAIQLGADAEVSRFDLISREPIALQSSAYSRTEHVRHPVVMTQVAEAARTLREGQMEITLVPEELGRVRLTMTPSEAGMAVTIMAERPETLELMRRNIDLLARDLSSEGFENLSFSFGGSGAETGGSMSDQNDASGGQEWSIQTELPDTQTPAPITAAHSGLDLRL